MELSRDKIKEIINDDWLLMDDCEGNKNCDVVKELARIALASLEAEPVGFIVRNKETGQFGSWMHSKADWFKDDGYEVMSAYIAPPAPVSVPEWTNKQCIEFLSIAFRHAEIKGDLELDDIRLGVKMVNSSRAAMLQGADCNSPVIPDGLNIRAVAALREAVRNQWLKSDGLADKVYWKSMHDIANEIVSAMLAAAPQQEVIVKPKK